MPTLSGESLRPCSEATGRAAGYGNEILHGARGVMAAIRQADFGLWRVPGDRPIADLIGQNSGGGVRHHRYAKAGRDQRDNGHDLWRLLAERRIESGSTAGGYYRIVVAGIERAGIHDEDFLRQGSQ